MNGARHEPGAIPSVALESASDRTPGLFLDSLGLLVLALAVRLVHLDHNPFVDELNHVLAARSYLADGTFALDGGASYERAWLFTLSVAGFFRAFGESLSVARLPAVIAGVALVLVVYLWTRSVADRWAGLAAGALMAVDPGAINVSQLGRPYTAHAVCFFLTAVAAHRLIAWREMPPGRRTAVAVGAGVMTVLAFHLQPTTIVGLAGVAAWACWERRDPLRDLFWRVVRSPTLALGLVALVIAAGVWLYSSGLAAGYLSLYLNPRHAWAIASRWKFHFYLEILTDRYPVIWALLPVFVVASVRRWRRAALLCAVVFSVVFLVHSFAASKTERYIFYGMPFFFALAGMGISRAVAWIRDRVRRFGPLRVLSFTPEPGTLATGAAWAVVVFAALANPAFVYTYHLVTEDDASWSIRHLTYRGEPEWKEAVRRLGPLLESSRVVLSSSDLKGAYYLDLGRLDAILSKDDLRTQTHDGEEFSKSFKLRVPVVSSVASVERIRSCYDSGLVLIERAHWRKRGYVSPEVVDYLEARAERVPLPEAWSLFAFHWHESSVSEDGAPCPDLGGSRRPIDS